MAQNHQDEHEQRLALFIDFENIAIGVRDAHYRKFDVNLVLERLLKDVKPILLEVARDFEEKTGTNNKERYSQDVEKLRNGLAKVKELSPQVRQEWAQALKDWPQEHANTLKKEKLPVVKVLNTVLDSAEKRGYKWPVRYVIK